MDSLPPEIKLKIFNQLSIRDSIKCRQVCKDWLSIIDCLRYTRFDFHVSDYERSEIKNFDEKGCDFWILNFEKFVRSITIDPKFSRIKVMKGIRCISGVENLDVLVNHFHELEELNLWSAPNVRKFVLNLKLLKKFKFGCPPNEVKLETPSLTHLMTKDLSNFEICYPEQIKYLQVNNASNLTKFKNLEILIIDDYFGETISHLSVDLLHQLPKLKRVHNCCKLENFPENIDQIPIDRHSELQVYYYGFRINSDLFGNFDWTIEMSIIFNMREWTSFVARNYSKSMDDNPHSFPYLDYTQLLDEFNQNIPNDFWKKISNLKAIVLRNLDEMKILKILDSIKPVYVYIQNPTISRSFLEQLSKFSFIKMLSFHIDEWPVFLENFDFKDEEIDLTFEIRGSLKSLKPLFGTLERARSFRFDLKLFCESFEFRLELNNYFHLMQKTFKIIYTLNGELFSTCCEMESLDFCFYLDRQVPSIVEFKDKLRVFFMVEEYKTQKRIEGKIIRELCRNPTISIKF